MSGNGTEHGAGPLPVPLWMANHGVTYEEWGGEIRCRRHHTRLGRGDLAKPCPWCLKEAREHEVATRDD